jgi:dephospho-CoA kinase
MSKPFKVGVTGGIGSGKTTVVNYFKEFGVPTYIADHEAKRLMQNDENLINVIQHTFGKQSYNKDGVLNKTFIANQVFQDTEKLKKLNNIVHPAVRKDFQNWYSIQKSPYVIYESALIFEHEQQDVFDIIILVKAPVKIRISRIKKRSHWSEKDIQNRMDKQMDDNLKQNKVKYIINNIDINNLKKDISIINDKILTDIRNRA